MARTGTINDLDNSLLLNRDKQSQAAGKLREEKSSSAKATEDESAETEAGTGGETQSLRQRVMAARQALNLKEQAKKKIEEKVTAPAKQGLNNLLKQSWLNLIDSFGLTLIWINLHVFLRWSVSDKLFCALGEEWLPKQVTQAGGDAAKTASKGFGLLEIVVLLILDLIILAVIIGVLALIAMIVNFMGESWWEKLKDIWKAFSSLGWGGISALVDLFAK